ncbi:MAG: M20/M25/M40 family metallo-hydrolase [Bacteroidetes bacterium]|nr:MAG: M20/M25/M40 family metallo-hydrolase [Bacteroidota bacterium]
MKYLLTFIFIFSFIVAFSQDLQRVRKNLDTLCSPTMAGRGYLENGDRKAANYIAQRFFELNLKPFGKDFFQIFPIDINVFPKIELILGKQKLTEGEDFIINPNSLSAKGKAKVFLLDTLIFSEEKVKKAFLNLKLSDKILVYHSKFQERINKLSTEFQQKIAESKAILIFKPKLTMSLAQIQNSIPIFEVSDKFFTSQITGISFIVQAKLLQNYETQNVIGYFEGTEKPDSLLVFSAHYDHLGKLGNAIFYGANDNASGISMLLELADHFKRNPPKYSVAFIAFGAEEIGLLGSQYFVEFPLFDLKKIKFLLNIDLVGTGVEGAMVVNGTIFKKEFEILHSINATQQFFVKLGKRGQAANSDHYFFYLKGVKCFFIYTLGGIQAYHDVFDKAQTLPLSHYSQLYQLILDFVGQL